MIILKRTRSEDNDFQQVVRALDLDLKIRDGEDHLFYGQFNKTASLNYVIVAHDGNEAIGCGALREYSEDTMEIKRMFVSANRRGQGIATTILTALETWCRELNIKKCILETGKNQPEAIRLYEKNHYQRIPNFGKYVAIENSVCFEKQLTLHT